MRHFLILTLAFLLFSSCQKEKLDVVTDNRAVTEQREGSLMRIVNLVGYDQAVANGDDTLTNFHYPGQNESPDALPGTRYFPKNGRLSRLWTVPQDLLGPDGSVRLRMSGGSVGVVDTALREDIAHPMDYYLRPADEWLADGEPAVVAVERGISSPAKPDHIKVRVVNLTGEIGRTASNSRGAMENLHGPVTLAYADGTPVSPATTEVTVEQLASEYIEIPYGTYQFKLLTADGRQLPGAGANTATSVNSADALDPPTSTIPNGLDEPTHLTYAPIVSYKPGGVYSIVALPSTGFRVITSPFGASMPACQNALQIVEDVAPPVNRSYARVQFANAHPDAVATFGIGGDKEAGSAEYGVYTPYTTVLTGERELWAEDAGGNRLAAEEYTLEGNRNYTVWLYPGTGDRPRLVVVPNDLSNYSYRPPSLDDGADGSYSGRLYDFFIKFRFLNLNPDEPSVSFTRANGAPLANDNAGSVYNLLPGIPAATDPYIWTISLGIDRDHGNFEIHTYRSTPAVIPGSWAGDIPVFTSPDLIARPELYTSVGRELPQWEPGIYTLALIGRSGDAQGKQARIMIVKHSQ